MSLKTRQPAVGTLQPALSDKPAASARKPKPDRQTARGIQAQALHQAARIAEATASPLASEFWNQACLRIQQLIEAEAAKLESEARTDN